MKRLVFTCIFCVLTLVSFCQISAELSATPTEIGKNGYLHLKISVTGSDQILEFIPPLFDKFIILSGPMQEQSTVTINGKTTTSFGISFVLRPKSTGKFIIGPAKIKLSTGYLQTNQVTVTVSKNSVPNSQTAPASISPFGFDPFEEPQPKIAYSDIVLKKGDDINEKINRNMLLRLETSKTSCYVGEPIVAEYKLYSRLKSESRLTHSPSFNGFSVVDMTDSNMGDFQKEKLNGKEYNVYSIRKAQLYPLQDGSFTLDPAELDNNVQFIKEEYAKQLQQNSSFFGDITATLPPEAFVHQRIILQSKPVTIIVKPLPTYTRPADFNGSVGSFSMSAKVERDTFGINETGKLLLTIEGRGNLQLLTAPAVSWPKGIDAFDPKIKKTISNNSVPLSGQKEFSFEFTVNRKGEFVIPPIVFSYFDPANAAYKTIQTLPLHLFITGVVANPVSGVPDVTNDNPHGINQIFYHRWWIIISIAAIALTGLLFWINQETSKKEKLHLNTPNSATKISENNEPEVRDFLKGTRESLHTENSTHFYPLLYKEYKQFLSEKLKISPSEINQQKIGTLLSENGVSEKDIANTIELLHEMEAMAYTPFEKDDRRYLVFEKALQSIEALNSP